MARETCAGCGGTGRGTGVGGDCVFCNGMGTIWVPDKGKGGPVGGPGSGRGHSNYGSESFEDAVAGLLGIATWGIVVYYGLTQSDLEWYWPIFGGLALAFLVAWLFKGPLRFVLTLVKFLLTAAAIAGMLYLIYFLIRELTSA